MKKLMWLIPIVPVLIIAALLILSLTAKPPKTLGPTSEGNLRPCPDSPNCVCSHDTDPQHAIEPFTLAGDSESELEWLAKLISDHRLARVVTLENDYLLAEFTSNIFRYVDDVEFLADADGKTLHVRSASRVGHSDLGANRKRIEILRIQFQSRRSGDDASVVAQADDAGDDSAPKDDASNSVRSRVGFETVDDSELVTIRSSSADKLDGRAAAERDIAAGKLILREQPLPNPPWWNAYSKLLRDECGIVFEIIKHNPPKFSDDDLEYNTVMKTEIERKFGTGILGKLKTQAQQ